MGGTYIFEGWAINKSRVAYYAFVNKELTENVEDIVCEDGVIMLISELNKIKQGLANNVSKTDLLLLKAAEYFACYLIVKSGNATQKSGKISSESIEGMSISYESMGQQVVNGVKQTQDWLGMGIDYVNRYAESNIKANRGIGVVVTNYHDRIFRGFYNKYRDY